MNRRLKPITNESIVGKNNHQWKGDKVGYRELHMWVLRHKGYPEQCSHCNKARKTDAKHCNIEWANIDGLYKRDLKDYIALCRSCHLKFDFKNGMRKIKKRFIKRDKYGKFAKV